MCRTQIFRPYSHLVSVLYWFPWGLFASIAQMVFQGVRRSHCSILCKTQSCLASYTPDCGFPEIILKMFKMNLGIDIKLHFLIAYHLPIIFWFPCIKIEVYLISGKPYYKICILSVRRRNLCVLHRSLGIPVSNAFSELNFILEFSNIVIGSVCFDFNHPTWFTCLQCFEAFKFHFWHILKIFSMFSKDI